MCIVGQSLSFVYSFSRNGFSFPSVLSVQTAKIVEDGRYVIIWSLRIQTTAQSISKWIFTNNFRLVFDKVVSTKVLYKRPVILKCLQIRPNNSLYKEQQTSVDLNIQQSSQPVIGWAFSAISNRILANTLVETTFFESRLSIMSRKVLQ